jgi:hypothetical protein
MHTDIQLLFSVAHACMQRSCYKQCFAVQHYCVLTGMTDVSAYAVLCSVTSVHVSVLNVLAYMRLHQ